MLVLQILLVLVHTVIIELWFTKLIESIESDSELEELQDEPLPMKLLLRSGLNWRDFNFIFQLCSLDKLSCEIIGMDMLALHIHKFVKLISMIASISRIFIMKFLAGFCYLAQLSGAVRAARRPCSRGVACGRLTARTANSPTDCCPSLLALLAIAQRVLARAG